jgi:beta-lactamase class A
MHLLRLIAALLLVQAVPAAAEAPARLRSLEHQLNALVSATTADVGIAAIDLTTGDYVGIRGDQRYPMASTVKIAVAANYLVQVEHGRRTLDDMIRGHTARYWMQAMMVRSDNLATDVLIRDLGGPATIQAWLAQNGVHGLRIDRNIAGLLAAKRDLYDVRDSATPKAMVELLRRIDKGNLLRASSRAHLLDLMAQCATGKNRIRGMLPYGTLVQHKTGTLSNYTSDVGFITLANGRRLAVAFFARNGSERPQTIATAARAIYDAFNFGSLPYYGALGAYPQPSTVVTYGGTGGGASN